MGHHLACVLRFASGLPENDPAWSFLTLCEVENGPVEIVDLPIKHGDFPQFFVCLPEGILWSDDWCQTLASRNPASLRAVNSGHTRRSRDKSNGRCDIS